MQFLKTTKTKLSNIHILPYSPFQYSHEFSEWQQKSSPSRTERVAMNPQHSEVLRGLGAVTPLHQGHAQSWSWSRAAAATGPPSTGVNHSNSDNAEPLTAKSAHSQEAPTRNNMSDMAGAIYSLLLPQWQENTGVMPHREVPRLIHRVSEVRRDLWRSSGPMPLLKQGHILFGMSFLSHHWQILWIWTGCIHQLEFLMSCLFPGLNTSMTIL